MSAGQTRCTFPFRTHHQIFSVGNSWIIAERGKEKIVGDSRSLLEKEGQIFGVGTASGCRPTPGANIIRGRGMKGDGD